MNKLYHYTSIEALYNILNESIFTQQETGVPYLNMRATHINYLNDETERKLFTDRLISEVIKYSEKNTPLNEEQHKTLNSLCNVDSFIISLSEHQDNLNMWRGYGGNGIGVNIAFDFNKIPSAYSTSRQNQFRMEHVFNAFKCKYYLPEECNIDNSLVQEIYTYLTDNRYKSQEANLVIQGASIIKKIQELATITKHKAYIEEKEWRFVCYETSIPKYSYSNGIIKPYINYPIPLSAISTITIGPCIRGNYSIISIEQFVKLKLGNNVEIKYSEIPYRR